MELEFHCIDDLELQFVRELVRDVSQILFFGGVVKLLHFCICAHGFKHTHSLVVALYTLDNIVGLLLRKRVAIKTGDDLVCAVLVILGSESDDGCDKRRCLSDCLQEIQK